MFLGEAGLQHQSSRDGAFINGRSQSMSGTASGDDNAWHLSTIRSRESAAPGQQAEYSRDEHQLKPRIAANERTARCASDKVWWPGTELNRRRQPFQGCALPPELPGHVLKP